jgi:SAM-dependent methyltransferase
VEKELKTFQHPVILASEKKCLEKTISSIRGYHLLLLGAHRKLKNLPPHHLHALGLSQERTEEHTKSFVQSYYDSLPFRDNSIDAVIISYLLEYCENPEELLKEIQRSLIGEGKLFLFGFERLHPWVWFNAPKAKKTIPFWKMKNLLEDADFSVQASEHFFYGAIYFIVAQKHFPILTSLRPAWKVPAFDKAWASPEARKAG